MTSLTIDDRILPSSGLDLAVLRDAKPAERAAMQRETAASRDAQAQTPVDQTGQGQWRVLRYL
ncbi:hypothetical protein [Denitrobaculum tricleocarpae]|uniref:Uncharacterized protein n=1 Tax=Denitrobaculum tricleocarpae TaxID=2591009 RepID=A0A545TWT4_9PROT|nr:hypothetical protein [Denitrobaculum tricleocarpae]TQV81678.1 hypothetical protein FKG95_05365 [Denitrobaculum tricleocarpae]